jgi:hypothetical protein
MKRTIAFHSNQLSVQGTEVALYDYALNSEIVLGHNSLIIYNETSALNDAGVVAKFGSRFQVVGYRTRAELDTLLSRHKADLLYAIKAGRRDGLWSSIVPTMVHAVFPTSPVQAHGASYAYISEWLSRHCTNDRIPSVPHIVALPEVVDDLRDELQIQRQDIVLGCHGGKQSFDVPCAIEAVRQLLVRAPDTWFVFLNIAPFIDHPRAIFLPGSSSMEHKTRFINTCDAMLHARLQGETFGLACGEFSMRNKPVITYARSKHRHHITVLGDSALQYTDTASLVKLVEKLEPSSLKARKWDRYACRYDPQKVMEQFDRHLIHPALCNPSFARPQLGLRWTDHLTYCRFKLGMAAQGVVQRAQRRGRSHEPSGAS